MNTPDTLPQQEKLVPQKMSKEALWLLKHRGRMGYGLAGTFDKIAYQWFMLRHIRYRAPHVETTVTREGHIKTTERPLYNLDGKRIATRTTFMVSSRSMEDALIHAEPTVENRTQYNQNVRDFEEIIGNRANEISNHVFAKLRAGSHGRTPHKLDDTYSLHIPYQGQVTVGDMRFGEMYIRHSERNPKVIVDQATVAFNNDPDFYYAIAMVEGQNIGIKPVPGRNEFGMVNAAFFSITFPDGHKIPAITLPRYDSSEGKLKPHVKLAISLLARDGTLVLDTKGRPFPLSSQTDSTKK